ncbi:MAG: carboxypeptidase regulatory-like domain-containing protein [Bacteroidia bacterium]
MKKLLPICLLLLTAISAYSKDNTLSLMLTEDGEIRGRVTDSQTGTGIPSANVVILRGTEIMVAVTSNNNGDYVIKPLRPGSYTLKASFVGYAPMTFKEVTVNANRFTEVNFKLSYSNDLPIATVNEKIYLPPMIEKDNVITCKILSAEEIKVSPYTKLADFVAMTPNTFQKEEGGSINVRGARSEGTQYYVDGIKEIGGFSLPKNAIAQIQVITGGIPAMYGDATGGIVVITTKSFMSGW